MSDKHWCCHFKWRKSGTYSLPSSCSQEAKHEGQFTGETGTFTAWLCAGHADKVAKQGGEISIYSYHDIDRYPPVDDGTWVKKVAP